MPRYIDTDVFEVVTFDHKSEGFIDGANYILEMIDNTPTEDVVLRSDFDALTKMHREAEQKYFESAIETIEQAKQEVASEIIDALIKTVDDNEFPCDTHDRIMWVVNSDFLTKFINDAKKKYIGK